jgi:hypothetical protein
MHGKKKNANKREHGAETDLLRRINERHTGGEIKAAENGQAAQFAEDIVNDVRADFARRAEAKRRLEAQWQLNANFVEGSQYSYIGVKSDVEESDREYVWQERGVYNHVSPIYETRLAKLSRVRPKMSVRPASTDNGDVKTAKTAGKILASVAAKLNLDMLVTKATRLSEMCGSAFYKITWDASAGAAIGISDGKKVYEGDVRIDVCSPYEIYPSDIFCTDIAGLDSIIHARAVAVSDIERIYGVSVKSESLDVLSSGIKRERARDCALVLERYTRPTNEKENGELAVVAGGSLLYYGELPYLCGADNRPDLPFVRQESLPVVGGFFGASVIERIIPVQRAYNAVKNRKHEFLSRIAAGVLAVEDGSVDADELEEGGLSPGKILVYRQGSTPPFFMNPGLVPSEFSREEDRLLSEFVSISGVSEITRSSNLPYSGASGAAVQLLIEQDDTRLSVTAENIRCAIRDTARHILRLYRRFAG